MATEDVKKNLITAEQKGKQAMKDFVDKHLCEEPEFFTTIKKMKLKTFSSLKKTAKNKFKNKVIPIKLQSNMFGQLALIMQTREIDLRKLFEYPVGPYPWSLCGPTGELRKTNNASLLHTLEKDVTPGDTVEDNIVTVLDGMTLIQKAITAGQTFGDLCDTLLRTVLFLGKDSKRLDLVFDVYCDQSIKNAERLRRGSGNLMFQNLKPSLPIKQWNQFLSSTKNKKGLIAFLINDWKTKTRIIKTNIFTSATKINVIASHQVTIMSQKYLVVKRKPIPVCCFT